MKSKMLEKLNSKYNSEQLKSLTISTLLDVRHKNAVKDDFHLLKTALLNFLASQQEQQESQNEIIPGTQGQELDNISGAILRRTNKSIFAFKDDDIDDEPTTERDNVVSELNDYKTVRLTATQKIELNLLTFVPFSCIDCDSDLL